MTKDTYKRREVGAADHEQQQHLLEMLNAAKASLRLDECRAWRITGSKGHIYTWGDGRTWLGYIRAATPWKWRNIKNRLSAFCTVTQDGDDEGCVRFGPTIDSEQAVLLRKAIGLRQTVMPTNLAAINARAEGQFGPQNGKIEPGLAPGAPGRVFRK
jgi:hypothetical protein